MVNKMYVGTIYLSSKGKHYGATTRQYPAKSVSDFRRVAKAKNKFGDNVVVVKNIKLISEIKRRRK